MVEMPVMKKAQLGVFCALLSLLVTAQDAKVDINVNKGGSAGWYTNPIVWIVGAAVFILLLVALLRGRR
jgi:hypothetical protein